MLRASYTYLFALFVIARDEVHLKGRNCLITHPNDDMVRGGLGRACDVPWVPAARMRTRQLLVEPGEWSIFYTWYLVNNSLVAENKGCLPTLAPPGLQLTVETLS